MSTVLKKRREKEKFKINIINKVNSGEGAFDSFSEYIMKLIDEQKYWLIEEVFAKEWNIPFNRSGTIKSKLRTYFNALRLKIPSKFQMDYEKLLNNYNISQIGKKIYRNSDNVELGIITETNEMETEPNFYDDFKFLDKTKQIKYSLEVVRTIDGLTQLFDAFDETLNSTVNLYQNYDAAFRFLTE
jgi:hypothetical protein